MGEQITHLCGFDLPAHDTDPDAPDHHYPTGHWEQATCDEYVEAMRAAGGYEALSVWSSCTDIDGQYGRPMVYTCWGHRDDALGPVAAGGGPPENQRPCELEHAVFVPDTRPQSPPQEQIDE